MARKHRPWATEVKTLNGRVHGCRKRPWDTVDACGYTQCWAFWTAGGGSRDLPSRSVWFNTKVLHTETPITCLACLAQGS